MFGVLNRTLCPRYTTVLFGSFISSKAVISFEMTSIHMILKQIHAFLQMERLWWGFFLAGGDYKLEAQVFSAQDKIIKCREKYLLF